MKLVLTGAAGRLGSYLREPLAAMSESLISTDLADDVGTLFPGEIYIKADLGDLDAILSLTKGVDMIVHFGAYGDEGAFEDILGPNIVGAYNIWESAYRNKVRRVVYASSIHAVGMHPKTEFIGTDAPHKPDTFYGLAKCFSEDLASLYWDKRQIESVCMRILSCAQVTSARALGTWLSYDDLIHLVEQSINTPVTGFTVVYGVSKNDRVPVDNARASHLGYCPKDNAEQFAKEILAETETLDLDDSGNLLQGGPFASIELGNSGLATMKIIDDTKKT